MNFELSDSIYSKNIKLLEQLTREIRGIAKKAGLDNPKFEGAWSKLYNALSTNRFEKFRVDNRFDVRAFP